MVSSSTTKLSKILTSRLTLDSPETSRPTPALAETDLLLMAQLVVPSVVDKLLNSVLLPNRELSKPIAKLLPSVLNKTSRQQLKLNVTAKPAFLLSVSKLQMLLQLELLLAVLLLPAFKPTALILIVTTAPSLTPTKLLLHQVVSTPQAPIKLSPKHSADLQLPLHPADWLFHQLSMLLQETLPSPEPTRPLPLLLELMPLPLNALLLANSQPLLLPALLLPPLPLAHSEVSLDSPVDSLELEPQLLVVHPVSLVPTPVPLAVSEPPPLLFPQERKPLPRPLHHLSVLELSLPKDLEPTEVTAPTAAMAHTPSLHTQDSLTLSLPTVAPMEATVDTVAMVATVDTNKSGDQGSVTF